MKSILVLYLFITIILSLYNPVFYANILNPLFWGCLLIYLIWDMRNNYIRFSKNKKYFLYVVLISCIYTIIYFYLGFIFGFSKSPYNHRLTSIMQNLFTQVLPILGIEITRCVILNTNKNTRKLKIFTTIIFILLETNYNTLFNLYNSKEELFQYICGTIFPNISANILYTYLTILGSYSLPLTFKLFYKISLILLPILPNLNWFITGSFGILSSALVYFIFKFQLTKYKKNYPKRQHNFMAKASFSITLILSTTLVLFMLGFFKYEPIVILSNSMESTFSRGDVIIYKKVSNEELKKLPINTIIIYKYGDQNIAHRIIDITKDKDSILYETKGDNNNTADIKLVKTDQIKGVYIFHIKYIGFPSIWLYEYFNYEKYKLK